MTENTTPTKGKFPIDLILLLLGPLSLVSSLMINILGFSDTLHDVSNGLLIGGLVLLLAYLIKNFKTIKSFFRKKQTLYSLNSILMAFLFLGVLALLNYIGQKNPIEFDLTEEGINTLSDQTVKLLESLDKKILVTMILKKEHQPAAKDLLRKYKKISPVFFEFKFFDEKTDPVAVKTFLKNRSKTARYGMASLTISPSDPEKSRELFIDQTTEETLTNGIIKLTQSRKPVIYFVKGHGELAMGSTGETGIDMVAESLAFSFN